MRVGRWVAAAAALGAPVMAVAVAGAAAVGGGGLSAAVLPAGSAPAVASGAAGPAGVAVRWALAQLGVPYRWGGTGAGGFDCSGLVQAAYAAAGIVLPRVAQDQFDAGPRLPADAALLPGDLVFFGSGPGGVDHVGLALGGGLMVDAPHGGAVVRVEAVWSDGYVGATRPAPPPDPVSR